MSVALFLPCRAGSERVPEKNTRPFAGHPQGLLGRKLDQLELVRSVDRVVVDSNCPRVLELAYQRRASWSGRARLDVVERPDHLGRSSTTTDELIDYALDTVSCDTLLWTHVTSPMVDAEKYDAALAAFARRDARKHDSLMAVTLLHAFIWAEHGPVNYDRARLRWPRTQDLDPVYEVNSAIFIVDRATGRELGDRIGRAPILFPLSKLEAVDVDDEVDFALAELIASRAPSDESRPRS